MFWFFLFTFLVAAEYTITPNTDAIILNRTVPFLVVSCDIIIGNDYCFRLDSLCFCPCFAWLSTIAFCLVSHVNFFSFDSIIHHSPRTKVMGRNLPNAKITRTNFIRECVKTTEMKKIYKKVVQITVHTVASQEKICCGNDISFFSIIYLLLLHWTLNW